MQVQQDAGQEQTKLRRFIDDLVKGLQEDRYKASKAWMAENLSEAQKGNLRQLLMRRISEWASDFESQAFERGYDEGERDRAGGKVREPKWKPVKPSVSEALKLRAYTDDLVRAMQLKGWAKEDLDENQNKGIRTFLTRRINDWVEGVEAEAHRRGYFESNRAADKRPRGPGATTKASELLKLPEMRELMEAIEERVYKRVYQRLLDEGLEGKSTRRAAREVNR